jgi:hypothetical protein
MTESPLPPRPLPPKNEPESRSSVGIWLALGVAIAIVATLAMIVTLAMGAPPLAAAIAIGGGVFALVGVQYLLWGWWLGPKLRREADEQSQST